MPFLHKLILGVRILWVGTVLWTYYSKHSLSKNGVTSRVGDGGLPPRFPKQANPFSVKVFYTSSLNGTKCQEILRSFVTAKKNLFAAYHEMHFSIFHRHTRTKKVTKPKGRPNFLRFRLPTRQYSEFFLSIGFSFLLLIVSLSAIVLDLQGNLCFFL